MEQEEPQEMSFLDHLEQLRWHVIRAVISIVVFAIAAFFSKDFIFGKIILGPSKPGFWTYRMMCRIGERYNISDLCIDKLDFTLQSRQMAGQFTMHLTSSLVIGLICAFPYAFWEVWRFIKPGLYPKERSATQGAVFFVSLLFGLGVLFGYFLVAPLSINFLANYKIDESIANQFDITSYISTLMMLVLGCGMMFELPMIVFVLTKAGLINPIFLRKFRKHSFVVILVVAALITPSPDILSQMLLAVPMYLLYEISISVSAWEMRRKEKASEEFLNS